MKFTKEQLHNSFYTIRDHSLDDGEQFPDILKEIRQYDASYINKFKEVFPHSFNNYKICYVDDIIIKGRQVGPTVNPTTIHLGFLYFSSKNDFWKRWNRFKELKVFL